MGDLNHLVGLSECQNCLLRISSASPSYLQRNFVWCHRIISRGVMRTNWLATFWVKVTRESESFEMPWAYLWSHSEHSLSRYGKTWKENCRDVFFPSIFSVTKQRHRLRKHRFKVITCLKVTFALLELIRTVSDCISFWQSGQGRTTTTPLNFGTFIVLEKERRRLFCLFEHEVLFSHENSKFMTVLWRSELLSV